MSNNVIYTADILNAMLESSCNQELRSIHILDDQSPGVGGMSNGVFEAVIDDSKKRWALKVIDTHELAKDGGIESQGLILQTLSDEKWRRAEEMALQEKNIHKNLSDLRNKYFVQAVKFFELQEVHLILMPYYKGLKDYKGKPEDTAIQVGMDICQALMVLHFDDREMGEDRHGILIHGDIKPQNIFYEQNDGIVHFKLGDFGTVHHLGEYCRSYSNGYYAPEVSPGSINIQPATDLFSLGMVLYWCVCGKDDALELEMWKARRAGQEFSKPEECSDELWRIILEATEPDLEHRIKTADEMLKKLQLVYMQRMENVQQTNRLIVKEKKDLEQQNQDLQAKNDTQSNIIAATAILGSAYAVAKIAGKVFESIDRNNNMTKLKIEEVGGYYKGIVVDDRPEGNGTYHYSDGSSLTGNWLWVEEQECKFFQEDALYSGMVCDDKIHGFGHITATNKWSYHGELKSGWPYGKGKFVYRFGDKEKEISGKWRYIENKKKRVGKQKRIYSGMTCNENPNGLGCWEIQDVGIFKGIVCNSNFCVGRFTWKSGEIYEGQWLVEGDNIWPNGEGTHISADGSRYTGGNIKGSYEGYGVRIYADGSKYEGMWKQDKRWGEGTFTDVNGKMLHAVWEEDMVKKIL